MELTVGRPVKILALVLVLSGVAGIASLSLLGKGSSGSSSPNAALSVAQIRARAHAVTQARAPAADRAAAPQKRAAAPQKRAAAPQKRAATPTVPRQPASRTAADGLPVVLADALREHRIVVVSIFDPQSQTDAVSYAEARAGAADAGAGFVGVDVLDDTVTAPLTSALPTGGLLPLPGILVYRAPSTLVERVDGFADRDSVAALALNAKTAAPLVPPAAPAAAPATTPTAPSPLP